MTALFEQLLDYVGQHGDAKPARQPVNVSTIQNWCDAMSESNPRFVDGQVAPPAMLNVWNMPGLIMGEQSQRAGHEPFARALNLLDDAGYRGVVAVNSDQVYHRELVPGDVVTAQTMLAEVSEEKQTGLGVGHFVTTVQQYHDQRGDLVGELFFRVLKYKPGTGRAKPPDPKRQALLDAGLDPDVLAPEPPRPPRPRAVWNQDQAWHWEGLRQGELRIQRFSDDGSLVHPPANCNPATQHMDYDWIVSSGRAALYSYTVPHYPKVPSFDYPLIVGLVELEEGVRLVSNITGVTPEQLEIGMPLEVHYVDTHDDVTIHQFRPARPPRTGATRVGVQVGDRLPLVPVPITARLIVSGALATRDFQNVHHDHAAAVELGSSDIFMNILTSTGLVQRYLGDWAGDGVRFRSIKVGLGAPNHPGDTMTFSGSVLAVDNDVITIGYQGRNGVGSHMHGTAELTLEQKER